jgi:cytochrome c oxidase subunit 1
VPLVLVFGGMLFVGNAGMQRRLYDPSVYELFRSLKPWNVWISRFAYVLALGQLPFAFNFFWSLLRGPKAPDNPWQVGGLEWTCASSPPSPHNFATIPTVLHGPHELGHPELGDDKDWLGQAEPLPPPRTAK